MRRRSSAGKEEQWLPSASCKSDRVSPEKNVGLGMRVVELASVEPMMSKLESLGSSGCI